MIGLFKKYLRLRNRTDSGTTQEPELVSTPSASPLFAGCMSVDRSIRRLSLRIDKSNATMDRCLDKSDRALDILAKSLKVLQDELERFRSSHTTT